MIIAIIDENDSNFAINLLDDSKQELAEELMQEGLEAWYGATDDDCEPTEHYTSEEIEAMYDDGYAEPAYALLNRFNIPYEEAETEYDDNGNIKADVVICY